MTLLIRTIKVNADGSVYETVERGGVRVGRYATGEGMPIKLDDLVVDSITDFMPGTFNYLQLEPEQKRAVKLVLAVRDGLLAVGRTRIAFPGVSTVQCWSKEKQREVMDWVLDGCDGTPPWSMNIFGDDPVLPVATIQEEW